MIRNLLFGIALLAIGFVAGWNFKPSEKPELLSIEMNPQVFPSDATIVGLSSPDLYVPFSSGFVIPWREGIATAEFDFEIKTVPTNTGDLPVIEEDAPAIDLDPERKRLAEGAIVIEEGTSAR